MYRAEPQKLPCQTAVSAFTLQPKLGLLTHLTF
jgi:hypothetical protein